MGWEGKMSGCGGVANLPFIIDDFVVERLETLDLLAPFLLASQVGICFGVATEQRNGDLSVQALSQIVESSRCRSLQRKGKRSLRRKSHDRFITQNKNTHAHVRPTSISTHYVRLSPSHAREEAVALA